MKPEHIQTLPDGQLIRAYVAARKRREDAKEKFTKQQRPLLDLMEALEAEGQRRMLERDTDSFKSKEFGTCMQTTQTNVTTKDRSAFLSWLMRSDRWELLDVRPSKKEIQLFAEKTGGELPPGVNMTQRVTARFRAPTNK